MVNKLNDFKIEKKIATLSSRNSVSAELTLTSFGRYAAKYDIRRWKLDEHGNEVTAFRGLQLTRDEVVTLRDALNSLDLGSGTGGEQDAGHKDN